VSISKFILCLFLLSLTNGCATANLIHHSRDALRTSEVRSHGEMRDVKSVSLDTRTGDLFLCLIGDFKKEHAVGDGEYTLILKNNDISSSNVRMMCEKNYSWDFISYTTLLNGCQSPDDTHILPLLLERKRAYDDGNDYRAIDVDINRNDVDDIASITFTTEGGSTTDKLKVDIINARPYRSSANRLYIRPEGDGEYFKYSSSFLMTSIHSTDNYDRDKYESIGLAIDILTSPVQITICLLTAGAACSLSPHPDIH